MCQKDGRVVSWEGRKKRGSSELGRWERIVKWQGRRGRRVVRWQVGKGRRVVSRWDGKGGRVVKWQGGSFSVVFKGGGCRVTPRFYLFISDVD